MLIGWIAGGVGVIGLGLMAFAWRGRRIAASPKPGRCRRVVFGVGAIVAIAGAVGVLVPSARNTPLLRVMPTDVLIAWAEVIPRSWLLDPISIDDAMLGRTAGEALNRRPLSDTQKRTLTKRIDAMLTREDSLEGIAMLAHARPLWQHEGVPLSDETRLHVLDLWAQQMETDPTYDVSASSDVLRGLSNANAGFGTVVADGFRTPTQDEAFVIDRFLAAAASLPIDHEGVGSVAASVSATNIELLGPWFPEGTALLLRWANEQERDFSKRSQRASAAIASLTLAGVWDEEYRDIAAGLMRSDNDAVAFAACLLRIHEDRFAMAYRPVLMEIARSEDREYVFVAAASSLVQMGAMDRELYELLKAKGTVARETRGQVYRTAMRFPAPFVGPDIDLFLDVVAAAEGKQQAQMVGGMMYLHRTLEQADPAGAERVLAAGREYAESEDENVRQSAFWAE
ncbi:MAG: hypothetical protein AAFS11_02835 [Planctomycetota bacterium]